MAERKILAFDSFYITCRGLFVSVPVASTDNIRAGDKVEFILNIATQANAVVCEKIDYTVQGIEESRCLVAHGAGVPQCVTSRGLLVRPTNG